MTICVPRSSASAMKPGARIDKNQLCDRLHVSRQPLAGGDLPPRRGAPGRGRAAEGHLRRPHPARRRERSGLRPAGARGRHRRGDRARRSTTRASIGSIACSPTRRRRSRPRTGRNSTPSTSASTPFSSTGWPCAASPQVVESSRAQLERIRRLLLPTPGRSQNTLREHRAVFAALGLRDAGKAGAAMGDPSRRGHGRAQAVRRAPARSVRDLNERPEGA